MVDIELVGNALCLDFANTVNARPVARRDWLATPESAATWAAAAGHPLNGIAQELTAVLPRARALREVVFGVFQPIAHGKHPGQDDLAALLAQYAAAVRLARLEVDDDGLYRLTWPGARVPSALMWAVAASAVELLNRGPLDRVGECPSCHWLFLDTSKNRGRRWCSMATCGSRDKARRYYASHATSPEAGGSRSGAPS